MLKYIYIHLYSYLVRRPVSAGGFFMLKIYSINCFLNLPNLLPVPARLISSLAYPLGFQFSVFNCQGA